MTSPTTTDPFATATKVPTVTFADQAIGTTYKMLTLGAAEKVHGNDFETGEKAMWKNKDGSTSPKYSAVIRVKILDNGGNAAMKAGEERAIWAVIPSAMFAALQGALKQAGVATFAEGGELTVRYSGDKPNEKNPRLNPAKQYQAKYVPGVAPKRDDPFGDTGSKVEVLPGAKDNGSDWGEAAPPW